MVRVHVPNFLARSQRHDPLLIRSMCVELTLVVCIHACMMQTCERRPHCAAVVGLCCGTVGAVATRWLKPLPTTVQEAEGVPNKINISHFQSLVTIVPHTSLFEGSGQNLPSQEFQIPHGPRRGRIQRIVYGHQLNIVGLRVRLAPSDFNLTAFGAARPAGGPFLPVALHKNVWTFVWE